MTLKAGVVVREDEDGRAPQRESWARALTWVLEEKGITHRAFAELLGWTNHTRLYAYLEGRSEPRPEVVFEMEKVLGVPPGHLSIHLGYVPPGSQLQPADLRAAIEASPGLPEWGRRLLLHALTEIEASRGGRRR